MDFLILISDLLLFSGIFLFVMGALFFFVPLILVRWNEAGNRFIGETTPSSKRSTVNRILSADYAIFANHRVTGGIMWGLSSLFLIIYLLYV